MNNLQLIKRLLELPLDLPVYAEDREMPPYEVTEVRTKDAKYLGEDGILLG